jgi:Mce-associated membrane protein
MVRRLLAAMLVMSLVIAAIVLGVTAPRMFLDLWGLWQAEQAGAEAVVVARSYTVDMLSYDYRSIEKDLSRGQRHATGALAERYRRMAATLAPDARRRQVVQQASVAGTAVESAAPDKVRVLVFVNIATSERGTSDDQPKQQVSQNRVRLVLVRSGDGWLVSEPSTLLGNTPIR